MAKPKAMFVVSLGTVVYWICAIWVTFHAFPIFIDGGGRMVDFYWGNRAPSEYPQIAYAYLAAASVLTLLGCGTVWLLRRAPTGPWQTFLLASAAAVAVFCVAVGASDAGTAYHIWSGPTALRTDRTPPSYLGFLYIITRMSLLSGLLALTLRKMLPPPFLPKVGERDGPGNPGQ